MPPKRKTAPEPTDEGQSKSRKRVTLGVIGPPEPPTEESKLETEAIITNVATIPIDPQIPEELTRDSLALVYQGFVPSKVRSAFIKNVDVGNNVSAVDLAKTLVKCLIAYSNVGNNMSKLTSKVSDGKRASNILMALTAAGVVDQPKTPEDITLPRLAIAFMSVYLEVRFCNRYILQNQTSSQIDLVYKDVAFCGHKGIYKMDGYKKFYYEFSELINTQSDQAVGESKEDDLDERWPEIAQRGYENDKPMHGLVEKVIAKTTHTMTDVMREAITALRKHKAAVDADSLEDSEEGMVIE